MHTVFFGGIAQYYEENGELIQDNDVPFVKTIARVTRNADGVMAEYKLPIEMPDYLGAGSEYIPLNGIVGYGNGVLNLDELPQDTSLIGYIYGGIASSGKNIFFTNNGTQSNASSQIFKVFLAKYKIVATDELNQQSTGSLQLFPNPTNDSVVLKFKLKESTDVKLKIHDLNGNIIKQESLDNTQQGQNIYTQKINTLIYQTGMYYLSIETPYEKAVQKLIVD